MAAQRQINFFRTLCLTVLFLGLSHACWPETLTPEPDGDRSTCPPGVEPVDCADPCDTAQCPGRPFAECRPDYCGVCDAVFYDENGNTLDCYPVVTDNNDKRGECPPVPDDTFGTCQEECSGDFDCAARQKCCSNGCGHTCQDPVLPTDGSCPPLEEGTFGICIEECQVDRHCSEGHKCCPNGCGHTCQPVA